MNVFSGSIYYFLLSLFILVNANGIVEHKELRAKCREEENLIYDDIKLSNTIPNKLGCYLFCFLKDLNIMDDKGTFYPVIATDAVEEDLREASKSEIFACHELHKDKSNGDVCKYALELTTCFKEHAPDIFEVLGLFEPAD